MEWTEIDRSNGVWESGSYRIQLIDRDNWEACTYMLHGPGNKFLGEFKTVKGAQRGAEKYALATTIYSGSCLDGPWQGQMIEAETPSVPVTTDAVSAMAFFGIPAEQHHGDYEHTAEGWRWKPR